MEKKQNVFHRQAFYISEKIKYPPLPSVPQLNINKFFNTDNTTGLML